MSESRIVVWGKMKGQSRMLMTKYNYQLVKKLLEKWKKTEKVFGEIKLSQIVNETKNIKLWKEKNK